MHMQGEKAKVEVGATPAEVLELNRWSIDPSTEMKSARVFGNDGWTANEPGFNSWSGSIEGYFDPTDTTGQVELYEAWRTKAKMSGKFYVDDTHYVEGEFYITGCPIATPADDFVTISFNFAGTGALSEIKTATVV